MIVIDSMNHVGITVSDLDKGISFYKEMFDFEVVEKISNSNQALLKMGDILITLYEVEGFRGPESSGSQVSFFVDEEDFEDALDELEEAEIEIVYGPEHIRNGQTVVFLDPDGNRIELSYPKVG